MLKICGLLSIILIAGCISPMQEIKGEPVSTSDFYVNYTDDTKTMPEATGFDYYKYSPPAAEIKHPLLTKFPVVKSPMPYYVVNHTEINAYKYNLTLRNIRIAFDYWENATKGRVRFVHVVSAEHGIEIVLVPNIPNETTGEGGPLFYEFDNYSLIVGGNMTLEPLYGGSENRVQIMHEIGHVMGLAHNNNSHSVLFPYVSYTQEITPEIIEALDILYQDVPMDNLKD